MELSSKLNMDDETKKTLYENTAIHSLMNHIVSNIHSYLYSHEFIQYMFKYSLNKILLSGKDYLNKNVYSFHMKGSTTITPLLHLYKKMNYMHYSDFDFSLILNPSLFSQKEFANLRTLLILGVIKNLSIICKDNSNNETIIENCKSIGIELDDCLSKNTLEIVNTGMSTDDLSLMHYYLCNDSLKIHFDLRSLICVKILTNISNDYTSHMLISVGLKGKLNGLDVHLIDIAIPTYNSPSISYEWMLGTNKLYLDLPELKLLSQTRTCKAYICTRVYNYFVLDLQSFYIDQLYASHFTRFIKDGKMIEKMGLNEIMDKKYTKRFKRALYIQIFVMSEKQIIEMILKYGKIELPNKKKLVDLIVEIPNFNRILDA
jgi:hypothetical protein